MQTFALLTGFGILALAIGSADSCTSTNGTDCNPCGIAGKWVNDLGSKAEFSCEDGFLSGKYNSKVGTAEDYYFLSGRYTMVGPNQKDAIVGWSVAWNNKFGNSNSTASFTGAYYSSNQTIYTTWILTGYTAFADKWRNSRVGVNVFTRTEWQDVPQVNTTSPTSGARQLTLLLWTSMLCMTVYAYLVYQL